MRHSLLSFMVLLLVANLVSLPSLNIVAESNAGTVTKYYTLTIIVDPPGSGYVSPGDGAHTYPANSSVTIYWYHAPWHGLAYYDINGTIVDPTNFPGWGYSIAMNANYVVRAVFFRYYPLRVSISPSAAAVYTNHPVTFVANISDGWWSVTISFYLNGTYTGASGWLDNTPEYNYTISPQPTLPGGQITWNFTPTSAGVYFINAYAEDSWPCGAWAFGSYLVVQDLPPVHSPVAAFTVSPQELCQHDSVFFNASGSMPGFDGDSECPISEYVWDFGDGYSGTNRTVAHVYDQTGNYTVTLTVRAAGIPYVDPQYIETNSTSMKIQIIQEPPLGDGTSLTGGGGAGACRLM